MLEMPKIIPRDEEPKLPSEEIKRRLREKAELLAELEQRRPGRGPFEKSVDTSDVGPPPVSVNPSPGLTGRITADGRKLAGLMSKAKKLEGIAEKLSEKANAAREAANQARGELGSYMWQHGLK